MNKGILIQQRALACLSKSVAHILQRELPVYTMGNTGLLRREPEMTLLQPHLGDSRCQELRNSSFWPSPLFRSQLVNDGEDFLLEKGTPKDSQGFGPYQNKPFRGPHHNKKEASTGNALMGTIPLKAVTNHFPQVGGTKLQRLQPHSRGRGCGNPSSQWLLSSLPQSTSTVGGHLESWVHSFRRDWLTNKCSNSMLNIITNGYVLPFISKPNLVWAPLIQSGYKALQKELALTSCMQSLLSKNAIERVENVKSLGFYSHLFLVPKPHQRWRPVIDLSRLNTFLLVERFKMDVIGRPSRCLSSHPHPPKLKEVPKVLPQVASVSLHFPSLRTSHGPSVLYNDCKRGEADGPVKGNQTSPVPGRLADQGPVSGRSTSKHSDSGGPNPILGG